MKTSEKLKALRKLMLGKGIDAWILNTSDPHQSEYMAEHWKVRKWFSGFTGSAGICVITQDKAGLWTDSRYWLQAEEELSGSGIELFKMHYPGIPDYKKWLLTKLPKGATVGFDGAIVSVKSVKLLKEQLSTKKIKLNYQEDLVAPLWVNRPPIPTNPVNMLSEKYTGETIEHKLKSLSNKLEEEQVDYHLISSLDEIAWLFNFRGSDIKYNPVVISYAFLSRDDFCLFIDNKKLDSKTLKELESNNVKMFPYENIFEFLRLLPSDKKLLLDPERISQKLMDAISCEVIQNKSIITPLKGIKNSVEQQGIRNAHIQDGAALWRWICWIKDSAGKIEIDEFTAGKKLEEFREQGEYYQGLSFAPIVGYKENGAIVHYSAKEETAKKIDADGLLLVDSGGQYLNGTTDVTRTISLGNLTEEEKYYFTLVLAGHIDLARAIFIKGTSGAMLDTYARTPLWRNKLNYGHGTGHGVGHYLCVHEGPQSISPRSIQPVLPGSVTSNEPGMYLRDKFGIRIENMIICQIFEKTEYGEFCNFDTVTMCPIDKKLVNKEMLNSEQIDWLNKYHQRVFENLSPLLSNEENVRLRQETLPL